MDSQEIIAQNIEKKVLTISFVETVLFLIAEAIMGVLTKSKALFMNCVWDGSDILMLIPMWYVVTLLKRPTSERRPYGFSQLESMMLVIKCLMLTVLTVTIIVDGFNSILNGGNMVNGTVLAVFQMIVSAVCWINYAYLSRQVRKISSPTARAEIFIWKLDACTTLGVSIGFMIQVVSGHTSFAWIAPYIDPGIAIIMALILIREPIKLAWKNICNLMLFAPEKGIRDKLKNIVNEVFEETELKCSFIDVIQTGRKLWVEVYFTKKTNLLDLEKLEKIKKHIAELVEKEYEDIDIALVPDLED